MALVNEKVVEDNKNRLPDWALMIKLLNAFKSVAMIHKPDNSTISNGNMTTRISDLMAFIDEKILVVSSIGQDDMATLDATLWKKFRDRIKILELPTHYTEDEWKGKSGVCGLYSSILTTERSLYVPVFGNDPSNWNNGHSTMMDKMVTDILQVNTPKKVLPVNMPQTICETGLSLKSLTWQVTGELSDKLVQLARWHGRRRFFRV